MQIDCHFNFQSVTNLIQQDLDCASQITHKLCDPAHILLQRVEDIQKKLHIIWSQFVNTYTN